MKEYFSTEDFESRHRFDAWRDAVCSRLINARAQQTQATEFSGSFTYSTLADVDIASHTSRTALVWQRTPQCIRQHPASDYYIGLFRSGSGQLEQNGHRSTAQSGDMVIYDAARPFNFAMDQAAINIIRLPRTVFDHSAPGIDALAGVRLDAHRPGVTTLRQMMLEAFDYNSDTESAGHTGQFASTLFELIATAINLQKSDASGKPDLYARMVAWLKQNLHQQQLSIASLASAHHVSPRTVSRLFAAHDSTPIGTLWQLRLVACRKVLLEGRARSITEVAFDHGFNDMSHFSLAFRKAFGCSPTSLIKKRSVSLPGE